MGNIVLNNVVTNGTITPASPAAGSQFNLTNYSSIVVLPSSIASAAQALGNSSITGTAVLKVDATGATPANISARLDRHQRAAAEPDPRRRHHPEPAVHAGHGRALHRHGGCHQPDGRPGHLACRWWCRGSTLNADVHALPEQHRRHRHRGARARPARRPRP